MPFFEDLTGDSEETLEGKVMEAAKIGSNKDVSTTLLRQKMWAATNLSAALAGADPMKAIGDLVAGFWARDMQKELIALLAGIFGTYTPQDSDSATTPMKDHILDLTTMKTEAAKCISASAFIDACQLMGDIGCLFCIDCFWADCREHFLQLSHLLHLHLCGISF